MPEGSNYKTEFEVARTLDITTVARAESLPYIVYRAPFFLLFFFFFCCVIINRIILNFVPVNLPGSFSPTFSIRQRKDNHKSHQQDFLVNQIFVSYVEVVTWEK